jgi:hypothetical protein
MDVKSNHLDKLFILFLYISQINYGYRYVLSYNTATTAPTYQDTPFFWASLKYSIVLIILCLMTIALFKLNKRIIIKSSVRLFSILFLIYFIYLLNISLIIIAFCSEFNEGYIIKSIFFFPIILSMPLFYVDDDRSLAKYIKIILVWGMIYHLIYSFIQIANYILFDRLPALAYAGGLVRFGGGWDDPNSFGVFLVIPIIVLIADVRYIKSSFYRLVSVLLLICLLIITYSFSAILCLFISLVIYFIITNNAIKLLIMFGILSIIFFIIMSTDISQFIIWVYEHKEGSIAAHSDTFSLYKFLREANLIQLLFGIHEKDMTNESFYLTLIQNFGFCGFFMLIIILIISMFTALKKMILAGKVNNQFRYNFFSISIAFCCSFMIVSNIIPYFAVFPINFFFWVAIMLLWLTAPYVKA